MKMLALASLSLALLAGLDDEKKPFGIGDKVKPELVLETLDGKSLNLVEACEDELVVLVFWSLRDPLARTYEKRLTKLQKDFEKQPVRFFLVDSNYDELFSPTIDTLARLKEFVEKQKLELEILLDHDNIWADRFGALSSNHAFVLDPRHFVRFNGAIDDDPKGTRTERREWLKQAIEAVLARSDAPHPIARPIKGRPIQRKPRSL